LDADLRRLSRTVLDMFLGRTTQAAAGVLAHPQRTPTATQLASWGLAAAGAALGRLDGLAERVRWVDTRADSLETGLHQAAIIGSSWVRGLLLLGCSPIRAAPRPPRSWQRGVSPRAAGRWASLTGLPKECDESMRAPRRSRLGCSRQPPSDRHGCGVYSNRQIADRLVVSVRTVEGHLYRACGKLGATDRTELAALLRSD
jgi:Bacterial regulatory proteins, luxR family